VDFSLDEEQLSFKKAVIDFARKELQGDILTLDRNSEFNWDGFRKCAKFGVQGLPIPEQYGQDTIQIHGAYGYMTELGVERDLRDSVSATIYSGTSEIQRNIIAAWLGLPKAE
jgi:alkylation response protein AidB-like acyl-CoA dehydrogenase